jgi:hypothetical protein
MDKQKHKWRPMTLGTPQKDKYSCTGYQMSKPKPLEKDARKQCRYSVLRHEQAERGKHEQPIHP